MTLKSDGMICDFGMTASPNQTPDFFFPCSWLFSRRSSPRGAGICWLICALGRLIRRILNAHVHVNFRRKNRGRICRRDIRICEQTKESNTQDECRCGDAIKDMRPVAPLVIIVDRWRISVRIRFIPGSFQMLLVFPIQNFNLPARRILGRHQRQEPGEHCHHQKNPGQSDQENSVRLRMRGDLFQECE